MVEQVRQHIGADQQIDQVAQLLGDRLELADLLGVAAERRGRDRILQVKGAQAEIVGMA